MANPQTLLIETTPLIGEHFRSIRQTTEHLCQPLATDDYQVQSIVECSPPKWHLAHVSWFFETFILKPYYKDYAVFHPQFEFLFNSYYETVGKIHPRANRGFLSRPTIEEIYAYRAHVDDHMLELLDQGNADDSAVVGRTELGLQHEQQHQELLLMDIKHNFWTNPLRPAYQGGGDRSNSQGRRMAWQAFSGGLQQIGHNGDGFAFDNETPRHEVMLGAFQIADRLVTNTEYLAFMNDGGYARPELWLADAWHHLQKSQWQSPLYWESDGGEWLHMTLAGMQKPEGAEPVCHISFYEANAYAQWAGARLPTEAELEVASCTRTTDGNFADLKLLHPRAAADGDQQWFGDTWEWTASAYAPYPGFQPLEGSIGEYNGKFMCNQMVLRGGSCLTPAGHIRPGYRNFFYPHDRWPMTGIRLAQSA